MSAKLIAIIVLLVLLLIFAIQNIQPVVLNFLFWQISTSSVLSILVSFVIGLLTGCLLMMIGRMKKKSPPSWLFFFQLVVIPSCPIFCKSLDELGKVIKRSMIIILFTLLEIMPAAPSGPEALWAGGCSGITFENNSDGVNVPLEFLTGFTWNYIIGVGSRFSGA